MAATPTNSGLSVEVFGPDEADLASSPLGSNGEPTQGGWQPTQQGTTLDGSNLSIQQAAGNYLSSLGPIGLLLDLVINLLIGLGEWIAGMLEGVPEQAKTTGTGSRLAHQHDPITQWIGIQLAGAGAAGRVLSEGNWPHNFGGRLIALGGALIDLANNEPPSGYWKVRDTPAAAIARFGDEARQFRIGPVPPPGGAPYNQSVVIDGFFAGKPLDPAAFQAQWGFPPPGGPQLVQFFDEGRGISWNDPRVVDGELHSMRDAFKQLWIQAYQQWLQENPQPTAGQPPAPPTGTCTDPCELEIIEQLYSIALQINANNSPLMAIMQNLPALARSLDTLARSTTSSELATLDAQLMQRLDAIIAALKPAEGAAGCACSDELKAIANAMGQGDPNTKRIADSIVQADEMVPTIRQLFQQLAADGVLDARVAQL